MTNTLQIGLASWVINDGNYQNFRRDEITSFAIQFYAPSSLTLEEGGQPPSQESLDKNRYRILSKVSHVFNDWWVIETNNILCFTQQRPPLGIKWGSYVKGEITLTVDPYFYVERLSRQHDAPALIYNWRIRKIEIQTAPYIAVDQGQVRDPTRLGWREIDETRAALDDGGLAEYILHCERENDLPRTLIRQDSLQ